MPTWYQRATIRSKYDYQMIKLCSSIIKNSKGSKTCFYSKEGGLLIKKLSIKVTLKSLLFAG